MLGFVRQVPENLGVRVKVGEKMVTGPLRFVHQLVSLLKSTLKVAPDPHQGKLVAFFFYHGISSFTICAPLFKSGIRTGTTAPTQISAWLSDGIASPPI